MYPVWREKEIKMKASVQKPKKKTSLVDTLYYKPKEETDIKGIISTEQ